MSLSRVWVRPCSDSVRGGCDLGLGLRRPRQFDARAPRGLSLESGPAVDSNGGTSCRRRRGHQWQEGHGQYFEPPSTDGGATGACSVECDERASLKHCTHLFQDVCGCNAREGHCDTEPCVEDDISWTTHSSTTKNG